MAEQKLESGNSDKFQFLDLNSTLKILKSEYDIFEEEKTIYVGHCLSNIAITKSQCFQDIWVLYETKYKKNGFFLEIGASDGITSSNSYLLEKKFGWSGILVEPNPNNHVALNLIRGKMKISKECVLNTTLEEPISFLIGEDPTLSTITQLADPALKYISEIKVNAISLMDLLKKYDAPKNIDYVSIDTEGSEVGIIESFFSDKDNKNYNIKCFTIEHNRDNLKREIIYDLMTSNGYIRKFKAVSMWDDFYIKKD